MALAEEKSRQVIWWLYDDDDNDDDLCINDLGRERTKLEILLIVQGFPGKLFSWEMMFSDS
jgi:hypothetical protein